MSSTTVTSLTVYPVKSCAGVSVSHATLTETGLRWDRAWMVVEASEKRVSNRKKKKKGKTLPSMFVSQRVDPNLALVQPELPSAVLDPTWDGKQYELESENPCLTLTLTQVDTTEHKYSQLPLKIPLICAAPLKKRTVQVWDWIGEAGDEGDDAAIWFSEVLGKPVRLVRWLGVGTLPDSVVQSARGSHMPLHALVTVAVARTIAGCGALAAGFIARRGLGRQGGDDANNSSRKKTIGSKAIDVLRDLSFRLAGASICTRAMGLVERHIITRFNPGNFVPMRSTEKRYAPNAHACFSDGFPILLANENSLAALNEALTEKGADEILMNRFRPNVCVGGSGSKTGGNAWAEDRWGKLAIGGNSNGGDTAETNTNGISFDLVKPCSRCVMVTVDQKNPSKGIPSVKNEPLRTLDETRNGKECGFERVDWGATPFFAWNVVSDSNRVGEAIAVGDFVAVAQQRTFKERQM